MGAHRRQLLRDIVIGTTIERVIRVGALPVLMVNHEAQRKYEKILAPVDMSEASVNALGSPSRWESSAGLARRCFMAFVALAKGKLFIAGADQASVEEYVAREREAAAARLDDFLAEHDLVRESWSLRLEEGDPGEVISSMVEKTRPDLLVMGTRGRSGLVEALLGSATEACLRSLDVDILAVPPIRRWSRHPAGHLRRSAGAWRLSRGLSAFEPFAQLCGTDQNHQRYGCGHEHEHDDQELVHDSAGFQSREIDHGRQAYARRTERHSEGWRMHALVERPQP